MENENVVLELNKYISSLLWVDFDVVSFCEDNLLIHGGIDLLYGPDIEITFKGVFAVQGKFSWTISTDKNEKIKRLYYDVYDDKIMLQNLQPEVGYHLFAFKIDNDYEDNELFFYVFAKSVEFCIHKQRP